MASEPSSGPPDSVVNDAPQQQPKAEPSAQPAAPSAPAQSESKPETPKGPVAPHGTHDNAFKDDTSMTNPNSLEHAIGVSKQSKQNTQGSNPYSGQHKVPNIQSYEADRQRRMKLVEQQDAYDAEPSSAQSPTANAEAAGPALAGDGEGQGDGQQRQPTKQELNEEQQKQKQEMLQRLAPGKKDKANKLTVKGSRTATDPVTKLPVQITDADLLEQYNQESADQGAVGTVHPDAMDPRNPSTGPQLNAVGKDGYQSVKYTSPEPAKPGNILLQQFPAPENLKQLDPTASHLDQVSMVVAIGLLIVWYFVAFGAGVSSFFVRTFLIGSMGLAVASANHIAKRKIEKGLEAIRLEMHKQRGEEFSPPTPESVEWINGLLQVVWKLIDPKLFASSVDMVEDIMQQSLPGFIDAVKISDYGQGDNPLRIIAMRALPDQPHEKEYPREEWINQGAPPEGEDTDAKDRERLVKSRDEEGLDQSGDYVNYEVTIAYAARPGQAVRQHNMHLLLEFFLGLYDWAHIPIKIWAQVESFSATARLRMQFVQEPPFIRNLTFTLMGVPSVNVSVQPLIKHFPNVLDLPLISGFVKSSIAAAASEYVAPKSMTLNMAQMLAGGGAKKDTKALGVIAITIHHAENLSSQDSNGKSDPYIVLAFAKFGKPAYSSRIITEELNPVWEETAFIPLSDDEVKSGEDLAVTLWDSDKRSADDLLGRVTVPVVDLLLKPNQVTRRTDQLQGFQDADEMLGELTWSVAFYDKAPFDPKMKKPKNFDLPPEIRDRPELQDRAETAADTAAESNALSIPPSPDYPSGILSIIVHTASSLERKNLKGAGGRHREGQTGQSTGEPDEEGDNSPSAYAEVILNDELLYKTRTKQFTTMPIFEAGLERFVRNWKSSVIRVVFRDARLREYDPILGVVTLKLDETLKVSSQVTRTYSLQGGVGFGRASISVLFRSVEAKLQPSLLGWATATAEITSDVRFEPASDFTEGLHSKKLEISSNKDSHLISGRQSTQEGDHVVWKINDPSIRLPVYLRYSAMLNFSLGPSSGVLGIGGEPEAVGNVMFQDLLDDEEQEIRVPLCVGKNLNTLRQNAINEQTAKTHEYKVIGHLVCTVNVDSGLDPDHAKFMNNSEIGRHEYETYQNAEGLGERAEQLAEKREKGEFTSEDKKKAKELEKDELKTRHHGPHQFAPFRTGIWAKGGVKKRMRLAQQTITGNKPRHKNVESEA